MRTENRSKKMFDRAQKFLVGGVNSPVRSFKGVGRDNPVFISRAKGSKIVDEDGNVYVDYVCSWGASILGSAHPKVVSAVRKAAARGLSYGAATNQEVELAQKICAAIPTIELVRFVSSGTEAAMSAVRVARAFTKKDKIIKFDGCYHGHSDSFLVKGGSGLATFSIADSGGVSDAVAKETLVAKFNSLESVKEILDEVGKEVAAIIVEPVAGNMGVIPPDREFLEGLRKLSDENNSLLIFDEVITGFRVARGGAQGLYNVKPDLTCLGKVIGGGMNIAAYGGREGIMKLVSPLGPVYQAGTLSGNPLAVAAGLATLEELTNSTFRKLESTSKILELETRKAATENGVKIIVQRVGSMVGLFFNEKLGSITSYDDVVTSDRDRYSRFFGTMLEQGVYLPPSAFETIFVSAAHSRADVEKTIRAAVVSFRKMNTPAI